MRDTLETMFKERESELQEEDEMKKMPIESTNFDEVSKIMDIRSTRGSATLAPPKELACITNITSGKIPVTVASLA